MRRILSNSVFCLFISCCQFAFSQGSEPINPFQSPKKPGVSQPQPTVEAVSPLDALEFNGIMKMGGVTSVSVFDTKENRNYWIREGETGEDGLSLLRYKEDQEVVVISRGGVSKSLSLKSVKIEPLKISQIQPTPQVAPQTPPGVVEKNSSGETDEDVRKRMQKVAEEIRRRRAERRARIQESRSSDSN